MAKNEIRKCSFCGKPIKCDCCYSDYGIVKLDNSRALHLEFDACEECLEKLVTIVQKLFCNTN